ncbi:hypothetical protein M0R45_002218 [Rubus argutus]|uniref:Uncharacterized protein n=1 Tax=Rubus argutus TaxID=59490 RepID=A0AAW1VHL8_RUBAR
MLKELGGGRRRLGTAEAAAAATASGGDELGSTWVRRRHGAAAVIGCCNGHGSVRIKRLGHGLWSEVAGNFVLAGYGG